ncbi:MAG: DNA-3-methyladenine glycosylase [Candidatus Saccharibacteria bacterium]
MQNALDHLSKNDFLLADIIKAHGIPTFAPHTNYYQELASSIISQQLSVKAAATIEKRFIALFGDAPFPTPEQILEKDVEEMRAVGLSRPKAGYIQDLAMKVLDGTVKFEHLDQLSNQEVIDELTQIKGVGVWTAHMFLMFCMGRLDVLPVGDLGIRNGIQRLYGLDRLPSPEDIELIAKDNKWNPYESVASWYIWQSLDNAPKL